MFKKKPKTLAPAATLSSKPIRGVDAKLEPDDKGGGKLVIPLRARKFMGVFKMPEGAKKTFELDEIGVYVWNRLDGATTVEQLLRAIAKQYKLDLRQAEASTVAFLNMLIKRGLVGLLAEKMESNE